MALALTKTFVCSEPVDGLVPESGHMSISPLFFSLWIEVSESITTVM